MLQKLKNLQKNLKNIYLCKKSRYSGRLKYPYCVLPKTSFKLKMNFDDLIENHSIFVLRRSDLPADETFHIFNDGTVILNDDAIENKRVPDLSINLMGGIFKKSHSIYIAIKDGIKPWKGEKIYLSEHILNYEINGGYGNIFINANSLHNKTIPYIVPFDVNIHKEITKFQKMVGNKNDNVILNVPPNDFELKGKIYFKHDPVTLNYWHIELKIENYRDEILSKVINTPNKKFVQELFDNWIKINSYPNVIKFEKINKSYYTV